MKNTFKVLSLVGVFSVLMAQSVFADDANPMWDVSGATNGGFVHTTSNGQGQHTWSLNGTASYFVMPQVEAGLGVIWSNNQDQGTSTSLLTLLAEPTYDFSTDVQNSIFIQGGIGLTWNSVSDSSFNFNQSYHQLTWLVGLGRRVEIVKHVTWTPEVTWSGFKSATDNLGNFQATTTNISIIPIQISVLF